VSTLLTHERRRFPRAPRRFTPTDGTDIWLPMSATVQVLDISQSGLLLSSSQELTVGRRAQLRLRLGADPVTAQVEIRRVFKESRSGAPVYRLGVTFVGLDDDTRAKIERFLKNPVS
jgi:PilZ domain